MTSIPIMIWPYNFASFIWFGIVLVILLGSCFPGNEHILAYIIVFLIILSVIDSLILGPAFKKAFQRGKL